MKDKPAKHGGLIHVFMSRPILTSALLVGVAVAAALALTPNPLAPITRAILAWDAFCGWFIAIAIWSMRGAQAEDIAQRAARQDEGRHLILGIVILAAAVSLTAVALELSQAKADADLEKTVRIGLAFATVAASWFMVQLVFAFHYAHGYYSKAVGGGTVGGLAFPGGEKPDYWDFLHFAVIIGVASQTADIAFTSKPLRRVGTLHGVLAFTFNTIVLALTINLLAGLF